MWIKRLDLLEKLIRESDHDELELEVTALERSEEISESNKELISKLRNCCAEEALETISQLRKTVELPEPGSNVDLQGLRTESSLLETRLSVHSSPVVSQGVVYFGSDDGHVYASDALSGDLLWKHRIGYPIRSSPLIHGSNLVIGEASLYCLY